MRKWSRWFETFIRLNSAYHAKHSSPAEFTISNLRKNTKKIKEVLACKSALWNSFPFFRICKSQRQPIWKFLVSYLENWGHVTIRIFQNFLFFLQKLFNWLCAWYWHMIKFMWLQELLSNSYPIVKLIQNSVIKNYR